MISPLKLLLSSILLVVVGKLQAENVFYNGSFELGKCGYSILRNYRPKVNPKLETNLPVLDSSTKVDGEFSLRIDNPYQEEYTLECREFDLPADVFVSISFYAKTDGDGDIQPRSEFRAPKIPLNVVHRSFRLTKEWKKYAYTIKTEKDQGGTYIIRFIRRANQPGSVWFDDIRVSVSGENDEFKGIEAGYEVDKILYDLGDLVHGKLFLRNTSDKPFAAKIPVYAIDDYFKTRKTIFETDIYLAPDERKEFSFIYKTDRIGAFSLKSTHPGLREYQANVSVVGKYIPRKLDLAHDAVVGFNGGTNTWLMKNMEKTYPAINVNPEERLAMLSRLGVRLLRSHDTGYAIGNWFIFEPEKEKFNADKLDFDLPLYRKYNIEMLAVPLNSDFRKRKYGWETYKFGNWLYPLCEEAKRGGKDLFYPPKEEFRRFIREFAKRVKGKIRLFEIFNEPQFYMDINRYLEYLKIASEELRKEIPNAYIIAFCSTSDKGDNISDFVEKGLKAGGDKFCNAISFHPYATPQIGSPNPADEQIEGFQKAIRPMTKAKLWNTELYYLAAADFSDSYTSSVYQPHHAAARFLIDLGEGVEQSCPAHLNGIWKKDMSANFKTGNGSQGYDGTFNAIGIAYNPLARFFEGAKPAGKIRYPNGVICYIYTRDRREIAAIWNYGSRRDLSADFSGFAVMDMFGNPLQSGEHRLTAAPFYLQPKDGARSFGDTLKKLSIKMERNLIASPAARLVEDKNGNTDLFVTIHNTGNRAIEGKAGLGGRFKASDGIQDFRIEANKAAVLRFRVKEKDAKAKNILRLFADGKLVQFPLETTAVPAAEAGTGLSVSHEGSTPFTFKIWRTEKETRVTVGVKDSTDSAEPGGRPLWEQDCVELFFDRAPFTTALEHPAEYTPEVFRLFVLPRQKKIHYMGHDGKISVLDLPLEIKTEESGYSLALSIPETLLPLNSGAIGFEIKIDDAEPSGKTLRESCWANGPAPFRNRLVFGIINFK